MPGYSFRYSPAEILAMSQDPNRTTLLGRTNAQQPTSSFAPITPAVESQVRAWSASNGQNDGRTSTSSNSPWPKGDIYDFLQDYYSKNDPKSGIGALDAALREKGFAGYGGRYDYGANGGLSNNELVINGEKWKVLGGEEGSNPFWYIPGSEDAGGGPNYNVSGEGILGGDLYLAAMRAAQRQRGRASAGGRGATILGGWNAAANAAPTVRPTVLGGRAA